MATRKTPSAPKGGSKPATPRKTTSRPAPTKKVPVGPIPHSKTLSNGQPRPTSRNK